MILITTVALLTHFDYRLCCNIHFTGLVNSILLVTTRNVLPDTASLPQFTTPRKQVGASEADSGVTPFTFSDTASTGSVLTRASSNNTIPGDEEKNSVNLLQSESYDEDPGPIVQPSTHIYIGPRSMASYPIVHPIGVGSLPSVPTSQDTAQSQTGSPARKETFASDQAEYGSDDSH